MAANVMTRINTADTEKLFYSGRLLSGWETRLSVGNGIKATLSFHCPQPSLLLLCNRWPVSYPAWFGYTVFIRISICKTEMYMKI
jgi:hypothetical protein